MPHTIPTKPKKPSLQDTMNSKFGKKQKKSKTNKLRAASALVAPVCALAEERVISAEEKLRVAVVGKSLTLRRTVRIGTERFRLYDTKLYRKTSKLCDGAAIYNAESTILRNPCGAGKSSKTAACPRGRHDNSYNNHLTVQWDVDADLKIIVLLWAKNHPDWMDLPESYKTSPLANIVA